VPEVVVRVFVLRRRLAFSRACWCSQVVSISPVESWLVSGSADASLTAINPSDHANLSGYARALVIARVFVLRRRLALKQM
jgi:hypothetical protein